MSRIIKILLIVLCVLILLLFSVVIISFLYVNKSNNLNPEETIKKYMEYWEDNSIIRLKSLESKEAEFVDVIRNSHKGIKIENLRIKNVTNEEIDDIVEQYNGRFSRENLKIYQVKFYIISDNDDLNGEHTFDVRLVHERKGWLVLSFGNP